MKSQANDDMASPELIQKVHESLLELTKTQVHPRPVAGGIVVNAEAQVRLAYSSYAGQGWHFPKGGVDEGETLIECAIREAEEEGGVSGKAVPSLAPFHLGPGSSSFVEPLAWGSPRKNKKEGRINQSTADLIRSAVNHAGFGAGEYETVKYVLFDRFGEQIHVRWRSVPTYFVLAYVDASSNQDGESEKVRWATLDEAAALADLHGHARRLLADPELSQAIDAASRSAR